MLKVVILSAFATPFRSGAEACAEEVAKRLRDQYDITIITSRMRRDLPKKDLLPGNVPLLRIGLGSSLDPWLFPFVAPFAARKLKPDIIHAVLETFAGLALTFCKWILPRAKRMLTLQTTNRSFLKGFVLKSPHVITAISKVLQKNAASLGRLDVTVIPNGIDLAAIDEARKTAVKVSGRILFVGRLEQMKGVDTLLKAFAAVASKNAMSNLRIVGEGSLRSSLEARVRALKLTDRVTFAGYVPVPQIYREYAQAQIFCGLSRSEALGNVFIEAQAAGCAVVATNIQGIPEVVQDEETGLLVPVDDSASAAEALLRILSNDDLCERLSVKGRKNAEQYDWGVIAERYKNTYESALL